MTNNVLTKLQKLTFVDQIIIIHLDKSLFLIHIQKELVVNTYTFKGRKVEK